MSRHKLLSFIAFATFSAGCARGATSGGQTPRPRSSDCITGAEMVTAGVEDAYQALRWLRPHNLMRSGDGRNLPRDAVVYLDGALVGGVDALHQIPASWVASIRVVRMTTPDPQFRGGVRGGAIVVTTANQRTDHAACAAS